MSETNTRFAKVLKGRSVVALAFGAMIGWSWVLITGVWLTSAGPLGTIIAFAIGGTAIALIALTYAELASAMPKAGGEHVYTHRALGPNWSFVCTWVLLFSYINVCLFESIALPTAIEYLVPEIRMGTLWTVLGAEVDLGFVIVGALGTIAVTWVNYLGISTAARVQALVTFLIFVSGIVLMSGAAVHGDTANAVPWIAEPASGILLVLVMVPAMLVGFDVIPQSAEEIDLPPNRIGRLLVISLICAVLWYMLITLSVGMALPQTELQDTQMATAEAARRLWSTDWAGTLLVLGGIGGILTSWNAFIVGGSRVLYALAESGYLPAAFTRLHPRYKTPYVGILFIGALSIIAPFFGRTILVWLINTGSFSATIAFVFVAVSFLVLRRREPDMPRPFRVQQPWLVGGGAVFLSVGLLSAFLPGLPWSSNALLWPDEWLTLLTWAALGGVILVRANTQGLIKR